MHVLKMIMMSKITLLRFVSVLKGFVNARDSVDRFSFGLAVVQVHPDGPSRAKTCEYEG